MNRPEPALAYTAGQPHGLHSCPVFPSCIAVGVAWVNFVHVSNKKNGAALFRSFWGFRDVERGPHWSLTSVAQPSGHVRRIAPAWSDSLAISDTIIVAYKSVSFYHILQFEKDRTVKPVNVLERIVD